jgi:small conductance mechanosensitive channel
MDDILNVLRPDSLLGAAFYLFVFVLAALLLARGLRASVQGAMSRSGHIDRTTISFLQQFGTAAVWAVMLVLYAHLIPALRAMGTALLTGAGIASVVIGLAAQSTLSNLIAGISIALYRPFRLGDRLAVTAPAGNEIGTVEIISLGYTKLRTADGRLVVLPNSVAASQVTVNLQDQRAAPLAIVIRLSRQKDVDAARQLALRVARGSLGDQAVLECLLTRVEATTASLELRVRPPDTTPPDALRSRLIALLAQELAQAGFDSPQEPISCM